MSTDDDAEMNDSPLAVTTTRRAAKQPLLSSGSGVGNVLNTSEQSYTEFYARMGTQDDELTTASNITGGGGEDRRRGSSSSQDRESPMLVRDSNSVTDGTSGEGLASSSWTASRCPSRKQIAVIGTGLLLLIVFVWWLSGGRKRDGHPLWKPAIAYEMSFVMTLPSGLEEPGLAMHDERAGMMRLSYYHGMTTYIINDKGPSYTIIPRVDRLGCFEEHSRTEFANLFPNFRKFRYVKETEIKIKHHGAARPSSAPAKTKAKNKGKLACTEWVYQTRIGGDNDGYQGTYTLWTLPEDNDLPVRFRFEGRSVILGRSHFDRFTIDYYNYRDLTLEGGVDPFWLRPPKGMPCMNMTHSDHHHAGQPVESIPEIGSVSLASHHVQRWNRHFDVIELDQDQLYATFHAMHSVKENSAARRMIFEQSLRLIETHNRDETKTYKLGLNQFADWTTEERKAHTHMGFKEMYWNHLPASNCTVEKLAHLLEEYANTTLPEVLDYVEKNWVDPPADQGSCGSSWAYAIAGVIEGQHAKKLGRLPVRLSAQNIIDCSGMPPFAGMSCEIGLDYLGLTWVIHNNNGSVATEESYPQLDKSGFCHYDKRRGLFADGATAEEGAPVVKKCVHVTEAHSHFNSSKTFHAEDLIKAFNLRLYTEGPLAVNVNINTDEFFLYTTGVIQGECASDAQKLEHGMLAVGYSTKDGYTKLKNSFGHRWGEDGYVKIAQSGNLCGVATAASYVVVGTP